MGTNWGPVASDQPIEEVSLAELTEAVLALLDKGLPTLEPPPILLDLKSIYARAVIPTDARSRLAALNELLPRLIAAIGDSQYRQAMQILFGLAPGTRGATLTARRRQAADLLGYNIDHFRTRVEDRLATAVTSAVYDDLLRYRSRVKRATESLEPTGDTPRLGPEHLNHEEELVSRIWQHVYGLRAEMIAYLRLTEAEGYAEQAEDHRQAAGRQHEVLQLLLKEYVETYGEKLIRHGETEFAVEALARLTGWEA